MDWLRAFRDQVGVEEGEMGKFIFGIVMDVLIHIAIQDFEGLGVDWISTSARDFAVLDSTELVVLHPEIGLENLRRGRESEQGRITFCDWIFTSFCF